MGERVDLKVKRFTHFCSLFFFFLFMCVPAQFRSSNICGELIKEAVLGSNTPDSDALG